jgi:hypothetical protein
VAISGNDVEISIANLASGKLTIQRLQVRGAGLVSYNPQIITVEDSASQAAYRKRALSVPLPLPSGSAFATALASYLLGRYKNPVYRVRSITFQKREVVNGVNLLSLEIGYVVQLSDLQTGVTSSPYMITGVHYKREIGSAGDVTLDLWLLDDTLYGVWDNATYGKFDSAKWSI